MRDENKTKITMKRTSLLLLAALLLSSCNIERELEYDIYEFEHNGHTYISFDDMRRTVSVIHSPDCPCNRKDNIPVGIGKEVQE